jgi:hypothetical protein
LQGPFGHKSVNKVKSAGNLWSLVAGSGSNKVRNGPKLPWLA